MEDHQTLQVPQDGETPVQVVRDRPFAWRYAYARSADTRAAGEPGQDYLIFRHDDQTFVFALCDGVSQSFFGDLAAHFLGDELVDWLWKDLPLVLDVQAIRTALSAYLHSLTVQATEQVLHRPLPLDVPPILRDVLEQKRVQGSESTFVCGRIDLPAPSLPQGRIILAWMGDSRLRLWGPEPTLSGAEAGERTAELGDTFHTAQRWSSRLGPVDSAPHIFITPVRLDGRDHSTRLMAYSDGLAALDQFSHSPSNFAVQDLITRAGESPTSDDVSFIEIWLGQMPDTVEATPLAAPRLLAVQHSAGCVHATWQSIAGASHYQTEIRNGGVQTWEVTSTSWESPPLEPRNYQMRVRGYRGQEPGEWSAAAVINLPPPVAQSKKSRLITQASARVRVGRLSRRWYLAAGVLGLICVGGMLLNFSRMIPLISPTATATLTATPTPARTPTQAPTFIPPVTTRPRPMPARIWTPDSSFLSTSIQTTYQDE